MIFNLDFKASVNKVMQINELLMIEQLSQLETTCFIFKYQKKTLPTALITFSIISLAYLVIKVAFRLVVELNFFRVFVE